MLDLLQIRIIFSLKMTNTSENYWERLDKLSIKKKNKNSKDKKKLKIML